MRTGKGHDDRNDDDESGEDDDGDDNIGSHAVTVGSKSSEIATLGTRTHGWKYDQVIKKLRHFRLGSMTPVIRP